LGRCAYGSAVVGAGDFPENHIGVAGLDAVGMAKGNIAVDLAVDQKDRNSSGCDRSFGRDLLHVEAIFPASVQEGELDEGAKDGAPKPRTEVKGLAHAVIGDFAEAGEGRFGGDRAETRLDTERLQEFCGAHRFCESEDTVRVIARDEEVEPLVNVVAFNEAVGSERAPAGAVCAGVGEKDGESVCEEEVRVSGHAEAIVGQAVEENYCVAVAADGMDDPSAKGDGVGRGDGNVCEIGVQLVRNLQHGGFVFLRQGAAGGMQGSVGYEDSCYDGEC